MTNLYYPPPLYTLIFSRLLSNIRSVPYVEVVVVARGMFGFLVIFLLSTITIQQTVGVHQNENRMLTAPAYQNHQEQDNYVNNPHDERVDDYDTRENGEDDKKDIVDGKEMKYAGYPEDGEVESRRLFEWFSRLFQSTTPRVVQTTITTTESSYERELQERIFLRALHRNLTEVLFKLSEIEKHVLVATKQKEAYVVLTKSKPQVLTLNDAYYYRSRLKRDVSNVVKAKTITKVPAFEKSVNGNNRTAHPSMNGTDCPCDNVASGRRSGAMFATPTEVKTKLLLYLQDSFQEIKAKIMSLKNLKRAFSDNVSFKIGYILANIDTVEVSMMNLKNNMDKNKKLWGDNKVLELYDTLKASNQAVSGLIETLKVYLDKLSYQPPTRSEMIL